MPTPFGQISTPNLTPDKATGIGDWSDDDFYRALHEGIDRHNEYLYPVFPFPWFTKVTREDVLDIKAYLFSLPPEHAQRKPLKLGFPFNIRQGLLAWRTAFFKPGTFVPDPKQSEEINRGAYLVEGLGHCGECHNRDNIFGASNWSGKLEGGEIEGWYAPNITSDGHEGIGSWSSDQIVTFLKTGAAPTAGVALGPMQETIEASLRHLSDADLHAIAAYLKSVTGRETYKPAGAQAAGCDGAQTYLSYCASCHQLDGRGVPGIIPALAGNGAVKAQGPENVDPGRARRAGGDARPCARCPRSAPACPTAKSPTSSITFAPLGTMGRRPMRAPAPGRHPGEDPHLPRRKPGVWLSGHRPEACGQLVDQSGVRDGSRTCIPPICSIGSMPSELR